MVTVAAITQNGALAKFSNFGSSVDIAAPGYEVKSTALGGAYASRNGTSVASAHVAGAAALLAAASPELTAGQIKTRLLEYAAGHQTLSGKVASGGSLNIGAAIKNERFFESPHRRACIGSLDLERKWELSKGQVLTGLPAGNIRFPSRHGSLEQACEYVSNGSFRYWAEAIGKYRQQNASIWVTIEGPGGSLEPEQERASTQATRLWEGRRKANCFLLRSSRMGRSCASVRNRSQECAARRVRRLHAPNRFCHGNIRGTGRSSLEH